MIRSSSPKEGKNDRSFRIRNDRICCRLAGQWQARISPPYSAGPELRPSRATIFVSFTRRRDSFVISLAILARLIARSCWPLPGARPCRASAVPTQGGFAACLARHPEGSGLMCASLLFSLPAPPSRACARPDSQVRLAASGRTPLLPHRASLRERLRIRRAATPPGAAGPVWHSTGAHAG